jgi:hypothetical protein
VWPLGINSKSSGGQATVMTSGQHTATGRTSATRREKRSTPDKIKRSFVSLFDGNNFREEITKAFWKTVEQFVQMHTNIKPAWENLSEEHRNAWIQQVINFYPPNTSSQQEIVDLARNEYDDAESLLPVQETCEAD